VEAELLHRLTQQGAARIKQLGAVSSGRTKQPGPCVQGCSKDSSKAGLVLVALPLQGLPSTRGQQRGSQQGT
jgi:hypothetical protein